MLFVWKNLVKISSTNFRAEHLLEERSTKLHLITKVNNIFGFEINLRSIDLKDVLLHLSYKSDKPHNPLVNSGAIMSAALILQMVKSNEFGCDMASKYELLHSYIKVLLSVNVSYSPLNFKAIKMKMFAYEFILLFSVLASLRIRIRRIQQHIFHRRKSVGYNYHQA